MQMRTSHENFRQIILHEMNSFNGFMTRISDEQRVSSPICDWSNVSAVRKSWFCPFSFNCKTVSVASEGCFWHPLLWRQYFQGEYNWTATLPQTTSRNHLPKSPPKLPPQITSPNHLPKPPPQRLQVVQSQWKWNACMRRPAANEFMFQVANAPFYESFHRQFHHLLGLE